MTTRKLVVIGALCASVIGLSCQPTTEGPPVFNAIDRSMQCEAGKVGWDFSTGGAGDQDVRDANLSNELRVIDATFGLNCGVTPGNWTEIFASVCNGRSECIRKVFTSGDPDPKVGCGKDFWLRYSCGVSPVVYSVAVGSSADNHEVTLRCGSQLTIVQASFGKNRSPANEGNLTEALVARCSGLRRCNPTPPNASGAHEGQRAGDLIADPAVGHGKDVEVKYLCAGDSAVRVFHVWENKPIDFQCPVIPQPTQPNNAIGIVSAIYGTNHGITYGNWNEKFAAICNGQSSCSRQVWLPGDADPRPGKGKDFVVEYTCGTSAKRYKTKVGSPSDNHIVKLQCGEPMTIIGASFGKNVDAAFAGNFTARAKASCDHVGRCQFDQTGVALFGSDPRSGRGKDWEFVYSCGSESNPKTAVFGENATIDFQCPLGALQATYASGIRIDEARYGANCSNGGGSEYTQLTNACYGKDLCVGRFAPTKDPSHGCAKDLEIRYRCGEELEQQVVKIDAEASGKEYRFGCEPQIKIESASYGAATCGKQDGNATSLVRQSCHGRRGSCSLPINSLPDVAPNCAKEFTAWYSCGNDPTRKTVSITAPADGKTAEFSCPLPSTPYVRKSCVPESCIGLERRDANLNCVADYTLPVIDAFQSYTVLARDALTLTPSSILQEDVAYDLDLLVRTIGPLPANLPYGEGAPITDAALWAWDSFEPKGGGARVDGFRCAMANPALYRPAAGDPLLSRFQLSDGERASALVGRIKNSVVSPACFGPNVASWRDAAKRLGMNEADFRTAYRRVGPTQLELSFDPTGKTVAKRVNIGQPASASLVPNPVGFFYEPSRFWVDFLSFYRQTAIPVAHRTGNSLAEVQFPESHSLQLAATRAQMRDPEVEVSQYDPDVLPQLEIDFSWLKQGDAPGRNPYSPTPSPLASNVRTIAQMNLGATVEITSEPFYAIRPAGKTWVDSINAMVIGRVQGKALEKGEAGGTTTRVLATFTSELRERILRDSSIGGWNHWGTAELGQFRIRVCMDIDGKARSNQNENDSSPFTVTRGASTFSAGFVPGRRCVVSDQVLIVKRQLEDRPFAAARAKSVSQAGRTLEQGNSTVNSGNDVADQSSCQRACTVAADCGSGQSCDNGGVAGRVGFCSGPGVATVCKSINRNNMGSGGPLGRSLLSSTTTSSSDTSTTGRAKASSSARAELLGFTVLDSGGSTAEEKPYDTASSTSFALSIAPNWDEIIAALKGKTAATEKSNVKTEVKKKSPWHKGQVGLGVGIAGEFPFFIGPVPLVFEVSAGVGLSLGLSFKLDLAGEALYPCRGSKKCFEARTGPASMRAASADCALRGGRLAELLTANDLAGARDAIGNDTTSEYWVGGQLAYLYPRPSCATNKAACAWESNTKYRWITSSQTFAEQAGTSATVLTSGYTGNFGGAAANLSELRTQVPTLAGVTYAKSTEKLYSRPVNDSTQRKYLCEYDPAANAPTTSWAIGLDVGIAAGIGAAVCVPTAKVGFCITAGINYIEVGFSFASSRTDTRLLNASGLLLGTRGADSFEIKYSYARLSGAITAQLRFVFFTIDWDLFRFSGLQSAEKTLYRHDFPMRRSYP